MVNDFVDASLRIVPETIEVYNFDIQNKPDNRIPVFQYITSGSHKLPKPLPSQVGRLAPEFAKSCFL